MTKRSLAFVKWAAPWGQLMSNYNLLLLPLPSTLNENTIPINSSINWNQTKWHKQTSSINFPRKIEDYRRFEIISEHYLTLRKLDNSDKVAVNFLVSSVNWSSNSRILLKCWVIWLSFLSIALLCAACFLFLSLTTLTTPRKKKKIIIPKIKETRTHHSPYSRLTKRHEIERYWCSWILLSTWFRKGTLRRRWRTAK